MTAIISQSASNKKTEIVYQSAPGKPYKEPTITVKGQRLQVVDKFPTLEAHCLELCTLVMMSVPGLPKLVQHLAGYVKYSGMKWNQTWHKCERIQSRWAPNTIIHMRN